MNPFEIIYQPDDDDIQQAVRLLLKERRNRLLIGLVLVAVLMAYFLVVVRSVAPLAGYIGAGVVVVASAAFVANFLVGSRRNIRKGYDMLGVRSYTFDQKGILINAATGEFYIYWPAFARSIETNQMLFLVQNNRSLFFFPRRLFTSDQLRWLTQQVPAQRR